MANNIFQTRIKPVTPKVLSQERVFVYVPEASNDEKGIASFNSRDFNVLAGKVSNRWPINQQIENEDPLVNLSRVKLDNDEFENTNEEVSYYTNGGITYKNTKGYLKLKRTGRKPTERADLIKVDSGQFSEINGTWKLRENELNKLSLVALSDTDFALDGTLVKVKRPNATYNSKGILSVKENTGLILTDGVLEGDLEKLKRITNVKLNGNLAPRDNDGNILLTVDKNTVGLNNVENKAFGNYTYEEFGQTMKNKLNELFTTNTKFNAKFGDWVNTDEDNTVQSRLNNLSDKDAALEETIKGLQSFLGYYENLQELIAVHPATELLVGKNAFLLDTDTYWVVVKENNQYLWKNTLQDAGTFTDYMETDASVYRPDGIAAAGSTGRWAQSDHRHPSDATKLDKTVFENTTIEVTSNFGNGFEFNLATSDKLNIPYVRKSKYLHNWNGSTTFVDSETSNEIYWAGSADEFADQEESMPDGVFFVDDGEDYTDEVFVNELMLEEQGITIDELRSERFVIVDYVNTQSLLGTPVVLNRRVNTKGNYRYYLSPLELGDKENILVTTKKNSSNNMTLQTTELINDRLLTSYQNGPTTTPIRVGSVLAADKAGAEVILTPDRLLISDANNVVKVFNTTETNNKLLVGNGTNGIKLFSSSNVEHLLSVTNGAVSQSSITPGEVITSLEGFPQGSLVIGNGEYANEKLTYLQSSVADKMILTDTDNKIKLSSFLPSKLLIGNADGGVTQLEMLASDAGKVVAVGPNGTAVLQEFAHPNTLPITVYTNNLTQDNTNGLIVCKLESEPSTYYEGALYLW